jgi:hypothetical protein
MTSRALFGRRDRPLTGPESRAMRAACNLERRHVAALANAIRAGRGETTNSLVVSWERSAKVGYPNPLRDALWSIESAIEALAKDLQEEAHGYGRDPDSHAAAIRRPLGGRQVVKLLRLPDHGLLLESDHMDVLDQSGGDFFQVVIDAAITRAACWLAADGQAVTVIMDKEPV